ncbi:LysM peptidoglycan-binding domain-containing protein [Algivirga pacifica]|uniref:LysM domain-containing protein n=1 Tax=Algivirga pacifica TaxID=1162670 RepID=A0ABP9CYK8_9BACT
MKQFLLILCAMGMASSVQAALEEFTSYQQTLQDTAKVITNLENPYPIITEQEEVSINGMKITKVNANGIPAFIPTRRQTLLSISQALDISIKKVIKYNDMDIYDELQPLQVYYLKSKEKKAPTEFHISKGGETLWEISQRYGVRLDRIAKYNRIEDKDVTIQAGRKLWLQEKMPKNQPIVIIEEIRDAEQNKMPEIAIVENTRGASDNREPESLELQNNLGNPHPHLIPGTNKHKVQKGEDIYDIAREYNVQVADLVSWNNLSASKVEEGQEISISAAAMMVATRGNDSSTMVQEQVSENASPIIPVYVANTRGAASFDFYAVQEGDQIVSIASKLNVSVLDLKKWNNLSSIDLTGIEELKYIPSGAEKVAQPVAQSTTPSNMHQTAAVQPESTPVEKAESKMVVKRPTLTRRTHLVQKGESLWAIANKYNIDVKQLKEWNGFQKGRDLNFGTTIYVDPPLLEDSGYQKPATNTPAEVAFNTPAIHQTAQAMPAQTASQENVNYEKYTVKLDDSIESIAFKYQMSSAELINVNNLDPAWGVVAGQEIQVRSKATPENTQQVAELPAQQKKEEQPTLVVESMTKANSRGVTQKVANTQATWDEPATTKAEKAAEEYHQMAIQPKEVNKIDAYKIEQIDEGKAWELLQANTQHVMKPGDYLLNISKQYNIPMQDLIQWNNIKDKETIAVGETIKLRDPKHPNVVPQYHIIRKGDSLFGISKKFNVNIDKLRSLNGMSEGSNSIATGTRLRIK